MACDGTGKRFPFISIRSAAAAMWPRSRRSVSWVSASVSVSLWAACNGPITIAIRARFEYDSTTIRLRFERDTTSYEELCAFEQ